MNQTENGAVVAELHPGLAEDMRDVLKLLAEILANLLLDGQKIRAIEGRLDALKADVEARRPAAPTEAKAIADINFRIDNWHQGLKDARAANESRVDRVAEAIGDLRDELAPLKLGMTVMLATGADTRLTAAEARLRDLALADASLNEAFDHWRRVFEGLRKKVDDLESGLTLVLRKIGSREVSSLTLEEIDAHKKGGR